MTDRATHAYIGINSAGSVRAIVMDDHGSEIETAKLVAEWRKMGRATEWLPVDEALKRMKSDT